MLPQLIMNSIIAGAIYSLIALGFNLIYSTVKFFDLGYGALTAVGGYSVFWLSKEMGLPLVASIIAGAAVAGLVGMVISRLVYHPLRHRRSSSMVMLVASLGAFTALQAIIAIIFTSQFQTLTAGGRTNRIFELSWPGLESSAVITGVQLAILISGLAIMLLLGALLKWTKLGKAIKAVADDEEVAKIVGINTDRIVMIVFFIGSAIAGLAGILVGLDTGIEPTMGLSLLLKGVVAAIVGGIGNVYGGVLGAFLLGFVENFGIWHISGEWKDAIAFALLIIFLLFRPQGILKR
ncbi:MAG: hypothetical protein A2589_01885 [Candidatus Vogelbacteria bacterium RIFOXYD1_FULL_46_19]|uniref:ABC transporter permease n=1 Tax=Candidatus Vogelbacteria bacterium RIFOXYD1_FULL_46_19 TaxID=1802439 RepID=A0A1G2QI48_9BACT|nr:MAG: hypothetical protein A2589_01885 [Candidatus Vogelbacteria bacterium RIFOXYD1_FULL_46_19]